MLIGTLKTWLRDYKKIKIIKTKIFLKFQDFSTNISKELISTVLVIMMFEIGIKYLN